MNKSKLENGEVIEEFRKSVDALFLLEGILNKKNLTNLITNNFEFYLTNALNQQREEYESTTKKESNYQNKG